MRSSHAHCLLCLNDNQESSDWFDMYVCIHLWSKHLNLLKTHVTALCHPSFKLWMLLSSCAADRANLNAPVFSCPLLRKWFSGLSGHSLLWLAQTLHTQTVGHSPRAKGKHDWKVEGRPAALCHSSPGEVRAGHSRGGSVGYPKTACSAAF